MNTPYLTRRHVLPPVFPKVFFKPDILIHLSKKSTCVSKNINNGSVPLVVTLSCSNEPALTIPGPWNWKT